MVKKQWIGIPATKNAVALLVCITITHVDVHAQNERLWSSFSSGFGSAQDGNSSVRATTGQPLVGSAADGNTRLRLGFLAHPILQSNQFSVGVTVAAGWNTISNPVTRSAGTDSVTELYPTSIYPYAFDFEYGTGYRQQYALVNGRGYWIKSAAAATTSIVGTARYRDSISVQQGWNLVGSISTPVDTADIVSIPSNLRTSIWFAYQGGYSAADQILPGRAYWVKTGSTGVFVFASNSGARPRPVEKKSEPCITLTIIDAEGRRQALFITEDQSIAPGMFELPPGAPEGAFDARFASQRMMEAVSGNDADFPITLSSATYPVTVEWHLEHHCSHAFCLRTRNGDVMSNLTGSGHATISDREVRSLVISVRHATLPKVFSLAQNYPNPFNPSATIEYALPVAVHVELKVYNILGQEVKTLVNEIQNPGYQRVTFDAGNLATGTYLYRLRAGGFVETKKLILLR